MNLALFDLDHTLIPIDSDYCWGQFLIERGIVEAQSFKAANDRFYEQYKLGTLNIQEYLTFALSPMAGKEAALVNSWHQDYMQEVIEPQITPAALALVQKHQEQGDLCALVTATNEFVTAPIAKRFQLEHLLAPLCERLPDGTLTGRSVGIPAFASGKITRVNSWLAERGKSLASFEKSWFYSDSRNDLPLLRAVSHPVATNADDTLRAEAIAKGWQCLELFAS